MVMVLPPSRQRGLLLRWNGHKLNSTWLMISYVHWFNEPYNPLAPGILPTPCSCSQANVERAWEAFRIHMTMGVTMHGQSNMMAKKLSGLLGSYHCWWLFHGYQIQTNSFIINNLCAMFLHISLALPWQTVLGLLKLVASILRRRILRVSLFATQLSAEQIPIIPI